MKFLLCILLFTACHISLANHVDMIPANWDIKGEASFSQHGQRNVLKLTRGIVWVKDVVMGDGTLEVDIAASHNFAFAGLVFRGQKETATAEQVYLRMHKSSQPDALQYAPYFNNESSWQLYPELQAKVVIPQNGWIHLKIVLKGSSAFVFVDTATAPALTVHHLRTENTPGSIGVWSWEPVTFSNFRFVQNTQERISLNPTIRTDLITQYEVSGASTIEKTAEAIPYFIPKSLDNWIKAAPEPDGLLNISRYLIKQRSGQFEKNSNDVAYLRFYIDAEDKRIQQLFFEFTNRCRIFLNGNIIYSGDNTFRLKGALFRGELDKQVSSQSVFLNLKKGRNEVVVALSSVANGWGWMARIGSTLSAAKY
jgi:hypothetical protein